MKMHNIKHDQKACRGREAVTKEHPGNPFSVFHNNRSLLCEALRNILLAYANLVTKSNIIRKLLWTSSCILLMINHY